VQQKDLPTLEIPETPSHFGKKPGGAEQSLTQAPQLYFINISTPIRRTSI